MAKRTATDTIERRADEALRRGSRVSAAEIVKLIHDVNPTGRELPSDEERRRYALKAKLQSLLLREFRDGCSVVATEDPGVVSLHWSPQARDACHARIEDLDEDERAWVRLELDLAADGADDADTQARTEAPAVAHVAQRTRRGPPNDLLRKGREALEAYDFDEARACFSAAVTSAGGAALEALQLLGLLVDHLAAYADARALEAELSPAAMRHPDIRSLLAYAAAQEGATSDAERLLKGAEGTRAADAWCVLVRGALGGKDLVSAEAFAARAEAVASSHLETVTLKDAIARARLDARAPAERELQEALEDRNSVRAYEVATRLVAQWPDSALARRVLREQDTAKAIAAAAARRAEAEAAFGSGELDRAERLFADAIAFGATGLDEQLRALRSAQADRRNAARIGDVLSALRERTDPTSLRAYWALASSERVKVRQRFPSAILSTLECAGEVDRDEQRVIAAALALESASALSVPGDPSRVMSLLTPHEPMLSRVPRAVELLQQARAAYEQERRTSAEAHLLAAREHIVAHEFGLALKRVALSRATAPDELRGESDAIEAAARARIDRDRALSKFNLLLSERKLFEALDLINSSFISGDLEWEERRQALAARLRDELLLDSNPCREGASFPEDQSWRRSSEESSYALDETGATLFVVSAFQRWLFIRKLDVETDRTTAVISMRTPEPLDFPRVQSDAGVLRVVGGGGALLELSLANLDVLRWRSSLGLATEREVIEDVLAIPGTRLLWTAVRSRSHTEETVRVFDLDRGRTVRELGDTFTLQLVPVAGSPRVFCPGFRRKGRLLTGAGVLEATLDEGVRHLCAADWSEHLVGLSTADGEEESAVQLVLLDPTGKRLHVDELEDSWSEAPHSIASSSEDSLVFAAAEDDDGCTLSAFRTERRGMQRVWRAQLPRESHFVRDVRGERVCILSPAATSLSVQRLGAERPRDVVTPVRRGGLPLLRDEDRCGHARFSEEVSEAARQLKASPSDVARRRAVEKWVGEWREAPEKLARFAYDLRTWGMTEDGAHVLTFAQERFAADPFVLLTAAEDARVRGDSAGVLNVLAGFDPRGRNESLAHAHHARGLALYELDRFEEARIEFEKGGAVEEDPCDLEAWSAWLELLQASALPELGPELAPHAEVLLRIRRADVRLEAGDGAGAQELLDVPRTWANLELQLAARLARAVLMQEERPDTKFRSRLILAAFLSEYERTRSERRRDATLPLGKTKYTPDQVDRIAADARVRLEQRSPT